MKHTLSIIVLFFMVSCEENSQKSSSQIRNSDHIFSFREIGDPQIGMVKFPPEWLVHIYHDSPMISKQDSLNQMNLDNLDYFSQVNDKRVYNLEKYNNIVNEENQKIDSLFIIDSIRNGQNSFVYVKSFKSLLDANYDFPPKIQEIDILIYDQGKYRRKLNIYSSRNFPYEVDLKLGYFNSEGILHTKEFELNESSTVFIQEKKQKLSETGEISLISRKLMNQDILAK